jgi:hypothetical protein
MLSLLAAGCLASSSVKAYGTKVSFKKGRLLKFPDFTLEYSGERRVTSTQYPRGFVYRDFVIAAGSERITASWTAGTGLLRPVPFTIGGRDFNLELVHSDLLGWLKPDELVIAIKKPAA